MRLKALIHPRSSACGTFLAAVSLLFSTLSTARWAQSRSHTYVTIYNNDRASIREVRRLRFREGVNLLTFHDFPTLLDPTSVVFRPLGPEKVEIVEQNFKRPISDDRELLFKRLGNNVTIRTRQNQLVKGILVAGPFQYASFDPMGRPTTEYSCGSLIMQSTDGAGRLVILPSGEVDRVEVPPNEEWPDSLPLLNWLVKSESSGDIDAEVMYQTSGMSWETDYKMVVDAEMQRATILALVTIENASGGSFRGVRLKLVAGDVQLFEDEFGKQYSDRDLDIMQEGMKTEETAGVPTFYERGFSGYHLYALDQDIDLRDRETIQVPLFDKLEVSIEHFYVYDGRLAGALSLAPGPERPDFLTSEIHQYISFKNEEESGLGIPLPKGRVRLYRSNDEGRELPAGEDAIEHTARGKAVILQTGIDPDLRGDWRRTRYEQVSPGILRENIQITLSNRKPESVEVRVVEHPEPAGDWEIVEATNPFLKKSTTELEFRVGVAPGQSRLLSYTIEYRASTTGARSRGHRGFNFGDLIAGEQALRAGMPVEAIKLFEAVVSRDPDDADGWAGLGNANLQGGNLGKAVEAFRNVLRIDAQDSEVNGLLAWCYLRLGNLEEARRFAQYQATLASNQSWPYELLAEISTALGEYDEAETAISEASRRGGDRTTLRVALGKIHFCQGKVEKALDDFSDAANEADPAVLNEVAWFLAERSYAGPAPLRYARQSVQLLDAGVMPRALTNLPDKARQAAVVRLKGAALDTLGWALFNAGDLKAGETAFLDSLKLRANEAITLDHLGQLYEKSGRIHDAVKCFLAAVRSEQSNKQFRDRLENSYRKLNGSLDGLDKLLRDK
jgi:tetratricopeptide (TPR) repeat protein